MPTIQKSTNKTMSADTTSTTDVQGIRPAGQKMQYALSSVVDTILASDEFQNSVRYDDFLVSPSLSPCDDFNTSPMDDSPLTPNLDTPIMNDISDDFGMYGSEYSGIPLFNDASMSLYQLLESQDAVHDSFSELYEAPKLPVHPVTTPIDVVNPTTLQLPTTDVLPASSVPPASLPEPESVSAPAARATKTATSTRRKSSATGTRKNISPDSLVPVDAPVQPRKYVTPSATSRKEIPAAFIKSQKRKRSRQQAFGDEEAADSTPLIQRSPSASGSTDGDDIEEQPPLNASEKEIIEWKRRQNTLAARKSRKRKLEHQQFLETRVKDLESESEMLKARAEVLEAALRAHNIAIPPLDG